MRLPRSKLSTKIIVFGLVIYAGASLLSLQARIEDTLDEEHDFRRRAAELELANAQLEYRIEHIDEPDVIKEIAGDMGYVMNDELVINVAGSWRDAED